MHRKSNALRWLRGAVAVSGLMFAAAVDSAGSGPPPVPASVWSTKGNVRLGSGEYFGTADASDVIVKSNDVERMRVGANGEVRVGTMADPAQFVVVGEQEVTGLHVTGTATFGVDPDVAEIMNGNLSVSGMVSTGGLDVAGSAAIGADADIGGDLAVQGRSDLGGVIVDNGAVRATALTVDGDASCKTLTILGGADLAEPFPVEEISSMTPGSVLSIDSVHAGKLVLASEAYDRKVAGVASGANGVDPGVLMRATGTAADGGCNVSLSGRAYVRASNCNGPIRPGDLLTTSGIPGHAMKVTDHNRASGATLGKAMTALDAESGLVLALVSLQ